MTALACEDLSVVLEGKRVVDRVSLEVDAGETVALLGPSGSGKSTLLRAISGLEESTAARLEIGGRDARGLDPERRDVAMVFQGYALYPHLTVAEILAFPLRVRRVPRHEIEARVQATASLLRLEPLLGRRPRSLSGGERQRVAIGRALIRPASILLLDEPLSNLDAPLRASMRLELGRLLAASGRAALFVTHDQVEAMTLGHRVAVLRDGSLEQVGTPREIYDRPCSLFVATFVGSPRMNLLAGRVTGDRFVGEAEGRSPVVDVEEGPATLGVRPEDLECLEEPDGDGWSGTVDFVEDVGSDVYLHVRSGGETLVARRSRGAGTAASGTAVRLRPRRVHLFGPDGLRRPNVGVDGPA